MEKKKTNIVIKSYNKSTEKSAEIRSGGEKFARIDV